MRGRKKTSPISATLIVLGIMVLTVTAVGSFSLEGVQETWTKMDIPLIDFTNRCHYMVAGKYQGQDGLYIGLRNLNEWKSYIYFYNPNTGQIIQQWGGDCRKLFNVVADEEKNLIFSYVIISNYTQTRTYNSSKGIDIMFNTGETYYRGAIVKNLFLVSWDFNVLRSYFAQETNRLIKEISPVAYTNILATMGDTVIYIKDTRVVRIDPVTFAMKTYPSPPVAIQSSKWASYGRYLFVLRGGGYPDILRFDVVTKTWTVWGYLPGTCSNSDSTSIAVLNGVVYVTTPEGLWRYNGTIDYSPPVIEDYIDACITVEDYWMSQPPPSGITTMGVYVTDDNLIFDRITFDINTIKALKYSLFENIKIRLKYESGIRYLYVKANQLQNVEVIREETTAIETVEGWKLTPSNNVLTLKVKQSFKPPAPENVPKAWIHGSVSVILSNGDNVPAKNVRVVLKNPAGDYMDVTDYDGMFSIENVVYDNYILIIHFEDYDPTFLPKDQPLVVDAPEIIINAKWYEALGKAEVEVVKVREELVIPPVTILGAVLGVGLIMAGVASRGGV